MHLAAAAGLLKLCRHRPYELLIKPTTFHAICQTAQAEQHSLRQSFANKLHRGLLSSLPSKYAAALALYALDSDHALRTRVRGTTQQFIATRRQLLAERRIPVTSPQASLILPEYVALPSFLLFPAV